MKLKNIRVGEFVQIKKGSPSYFHTPHTNYRVKDINFSDGIVVFYPNSNDYCFYCPEDLRKAR